MTIDSVQTFICNFHNKKKRFFTELSVCLFHSQEIQKGVGKRNLFRDTREHVYAGEREVSTGLLS